MKLGVFSRTFDVCHLEDLIDDLEIYGIHHVHFNFKCGLGESLPDEIPTAFTRKLNGKFREKTLLGISGTFNAVHPDLETRRRELRCCEEIIRSARACGTNFVSLCTGTRDAQNMWRYHRDNVLKETWRDLAKTLEALLEVAESEEVLLGIEPELNNVISNASDARRLLNEMQSDHLRIILDPANLMTESTSGDEMRERISEAFDLLIERVEVVHAKDLPSQNEGSSQAAGLGRLDWDHYFQTLSRVGYQGPMVMHNLKPIELTESIEFLKQKANQYQMELHT